MRVLTRRQDTLGDPELSVSHVMLASTSLRTLSRWSLNLDDHW